MLASRCERFSSGLCCDAKERIVAQRLTLETPRSWTSCCAFEEHAEGKMRFFLFS